MASNAANCGQARLQAPGCGDQRQHTPADGLAQPRLQGPVGPEGNRLAVKLKPSPAAHEVGPMRAAAGHPIVAAFPGQQDPHALRREPLAHRHHHIGAQRQVQRIPAPLAGGVEVVGPIQHDIGRDAEMALRRAAPLRLVVRFARKSDADGARRPRDPAGAIKLDAAAHDRGGIEAARQLCGDLRRGPHRRFQGLIEQAAEFLDMVGFRPMRPHPGCAACASASFAAGRLPPPAPIRPAAAGRPSRTYRSGRRSVRRDTRRSRLRSARARGRGLRSARAAGWRTRKNAH